jgi:4-amino-4-deoxy-L-arabinose transferase-like glycosyltransferase
MVIDARSGSSGSGHEADDALAAAPGVDELGESTPAERSAAGGLRSQRAPLTRAQARWLIVIVAVAAALRIAWLVFNHVDPPGLNAEFGGDQSMFYYHAIEIAGGRGYHVPDSTEATAYYPIGYPAILAGLFWIFDRVPFVGHEMMVVAGGFHVLVSVATVALTFVVGRRLLGPRAGLVAAALMAVFPNLIYQVTSLQLETTFLFLSMAALAIIVDHDWSSGPPTRKRLLVFGAVLAISVMVRPFSAPLLLGVLLALLAVGVGWRRALLATAVPVAVLVVALAPWTIRNAVELDAFVPSSTNMGDTLCIDRGEDATGGFRWADHEGCVDPDLPEVERNAGNTDKAIEFVVEHPGRELHQVVRRARRMFAEDHDGIMATETMGSGVIFSDGTRTFYERAGDWYFFAVLAAAVVGLPRLARRSPRPERRLVLALTIALLVIPLLLWGNPRFHIPLAPFLALSAAALLASRPPPAPESTSALSAASSDGDE